jgi:DnaK suppressor protein
MADAKPEIDEKRARELLQRERKRIEGSLADIARVKGSEVAEIGTATAAEDDAEVIEEETVDIAIESQLRTELEAVERAEQRLEDGTYGLSVKSGEPIPAKRLEAVPWAERTEEEQERYERGG